MDERRLEIRVGMLVLAALGGVIAMLWLMGELSFGRGGRLAVEFSHSGNVVEGAPVKLGGVVVGRVDKIALTPDRRDADGNPLPVKMTLALDNKAREALRDDTQVTVATQGPLGEPYLELFVGTGRDPLRADREPIRGVDAARLELVAAKMSSLLEGATRLIDQNPQALSELVVGVAGLSHTLDGVMKENREEIRTLLTDAAAAAKELREVAALARGQLQPGGKAAALIDDASASAKLLRSDLPQLTSDAKRALAGAAAVSGQLTVEDGQRLKVALARYTAAGEKLDRIAARTENVLAKIEAGEGSFGGLYKDPQVYQDLKALMTELKRKPWKILWKD